MSVPVSVKLKFNRGCEHLNSLKREMDAFTKTSPYGFREQIDEARLVRSIYLVEESEPPARIGLIVGDCVHNFRCVLDHLVFNLPRRAGTDSRWERWSQFPISDSPANFASTANCSQGAELAAIAVLESLQPYFGGRAPEGHPFWYLRELSNFDKHRLMRPLTMMPTRASVVVPTPETGTVNPVWAEGSVGNGSLLGKLFYSDPSPPGESILLSLDLGITIDGLEPAIGVQTACQGIRDAVEFAITNLEQHI